jgi:tetratricopeptide (TPR) repeat protein
MTGNGVRWEITLLAALLAACAGTPTAELPTPQTFSPIPPTARLADFESSYSERAVALSREGRWAEALPLWEILVLLRPDSQDYRAQLERTQEQIGQVVAERLKAADKTRHAGDLERATLQYLRVLSVDPQNADAARALREIEAERVKRAYLLKPRVLANRSSAERNGARNSVAQPANDPAGELEIGVVQFRQGDYAGSVQTLEKYFRAHPRDDNARSYLADAYQQVGLASLREGRKEEALGQLEKAQQLGPSDPAEVSKAVRSVRQALGEEYYRLGVQAFASDIDRAISLWERSLSYDPSQVQVQVRLQQARRAQRTMQSIEQNNKN